jgi:Transposase and inactivated derivatives, IS1 family
MNQLSVSERAAIVSALVEGNAIRAICRMQGVGKNTVARLVRDLGHACAMHANETQRGLSSKFIECDEVWQFIYSKEKNVPEEMKGTFGVGDTWTWTALDADSKLMISWRVGDRTAREGTFFLQDLRSRVNGSPQISTDGLPSYKPAIARAFGKNVDHGVVDKTYGSSGVEKGKYSPAECVACTKRVGQGNPDMGRVSTSYVERSNLTIRTQVKRYARLTNAHSKKLKQHEAMLNLFFVYYNFGRKHSTLEGKTPAQVAGIADHRWTIEEIVGLMERYPAPK